MNVKLDTITFINGSETECTQFVCNRTSDKTKSDDRGAEVRFP